MIGISHGGFDELSRYCGFGRSKNDPRLLFSLGLCLSGHGVLQGNRDRDVAVLDGIHRDSPVGGLAVNRRTNLTPRIASSTDVTLMVPSLVTI